MIKSSQSPIPWSTHKRTYIIFEIYVMAIYHLLPCVLAWTIAHLLLHHHNLQILPLMFSSCASTMKNQGSILVDATYATVCGSGGSTLIPRSVMLGLGTGFSRPAWNHNSCLTLSLTRFTLLNLTGAKYVCLSLPCHITRRWSLRTSTATSTLWSSPF